MLQIMQTLEAHWAVLATTYPPGALEFVALLTTQLLTFYLPATLFLLLDALAPTTWVQKHKLQSAKRQASWTSVQRCVVHVVRANALSLSLHLGVHYATGFRYGMYSTSTKLPSPGEFCGQFVYALASRELLFYAAHRALHHPALYRRIHKQHHLFTAPIAFSAQYAHPLEHLIANTLPIVLPLALIRAHLATLCCFLGAMLLETTSVHSGYDFALARVHDAHHEHFGLNYGAIGVCDWLFGTDKLGWDRPKKLGRTRTKLGRDE